MRIPLSVRAVPALTFKAWLSPPPAGQRTLARDGVTTADLETFQIGEVTGFEAGTGPVVLALHGWGGRPAQMAAPADALAAAGFRVVIPELPGHAGDAPTDIKKAAAAIREVVGETGMPVALVAHSFAAMVVRLAFNEQAPASMVLVAPVLDVHDALARFGEQLRLLPWARRGLRNRLENWDPELWPTISGVQPDQFPGTQIAIFHDPDDPDAPFARSAQLAAIRPQTSLSVVDGGGHSQILSDVRVVNGVLDAVVSVSNRLSR